MRHALCDDNGTSLWNPSHIFHLFNERKGQRMRIARNGMHYAHLCHYGDSLSSKSRLSEITCCGPSSWRRNWRGQNKNSDNDNVSPRSVTPLPKHRSFRPRKREYLL